MPPATLAVDRATASPGAKPPAAEPPPGRHRHPAYPTPARLRSHQAKRTGRPDTAALSRAAGARRTLRRPASQRHLPAPIPR